MSLIDSFVFVFCIIRCDDVSFFGSKAQSEKGIDDVYISVGHLFDYTVFDRNVFFGIFSDGSDEYGRTGGSGNYSLFGHRLGRFFCVLFDLLFYQLFNGIEISEFVIKSCKKTEEQV